MESLYDEDGEPSGARLHLDVKDERYRGMIRRRIPLGEEEKGWLVRIGVLEIVDGNYVLNLRRYPTLPQLRHLVHP